jgi:hypothetical protein
MLPWSLREKKSEKKIRRHIMPISSWQRVLREVAIREVGLVSIYSHEQSGGILQDIYYSPVHIQ